MKIEFKSHILKCKDCADAVMKKAASIEGISNAHLDVPNGYLILDCISHNALISLEMSLAEIGHPIKGFPIEVNEANDSETELI
ncbi:hypothetical protein [Winogradskyella ursingii]|uniref:hypothetical protein n=1 Tax=Winogradskyella ursingii TaxID=2686079 RepID=UPI0015CE0331|nr:hypothetical protein [Winogradskyella ursingii]